MTQYFTIPSASDGLGVSCLYAAPEGEIKAVALLSHGIMEYKERYLPLIDALTRAGFACAINDHRGHGQSVKSDTDLGYTYEQGARGTLGDMRALGEWLMAKHPGLPAYLYGHSMGALCALSYAKAYSAELSGVVLSGMPAPNPYAGAGKKYLKLKKLVKGARYRDQSVNKLMFDNYSAKFKGEASAFCWLNSDPERVRAYENDPKCGFLCTVDGYLSLLDLLTSAYEERGAVKNTALGVRLLAGADDPCVGGDEGVQKQLSYLKTVGFTRVSSRLYPGMRHEIHNEPAGDQVIRDIVSAFS